VGLAGAKLVDPGKETSFLNQFVGSGVVRVPIWPVGSQNEAGFQFSNQLDQGQAMGRIGSNVTIRQSNRWTHTEAEQFRRLFLFSPALLKRPPAGHFACTYVGDSHA
jgi:hypothetical protein